MLSLLHTPSGYALFKMPLKGERFEGVCQKLVKGEKKVKECLKLLSFHQFSDVEEAMKSISSIQSGRLVKGLKSLLKEGANVEEGSEDDGLLGLAVEDTSLAAIIQEKLPAFKCVCNASVSHLGRLLRNSLDALMDADAMEEMDTMRLALARSYSRDKVQFDPEKEDTMVGQAVSLIDDVDKELNNYVMRCREWYGWHFPELSKMVPDAVTFTKVVKAIGMKQNISHAKPVLMELLKSEELVEQMCNDAEHSTGSDITTVDLLHIVQLCDQIIEMATYRLELLDYLKKRMQCLAPNLSVLIGEIMAAKLVGRAGSLIKLAKLPASTIQLLGAEKALFRALKRKAATPKYGVLYHAPLITHAPGNDKAKMARKLAAKIALVARYDAFREKSNVKVEKVRSDEEEQLSVTADNEMGIELRAYLEGWLKMKQEWGKAECPAPVKRPRLE